jgi:hypothetical protein
MNYQSINLKFNMTIRYLQGPFNVSLRESYLGGTALVILSKKMQHLRGGQKWVTTIKSLYKMIKARSFSKKCKDDCEVPNV